MRIAYCLATAQSSVSSAGWLAEHHRLVTTMLQVDGHEVTIFGPSGGVIDVSVKVDSADHLIERVYSRSDSYDVIQWYAAEWPLDVARRCPTPTVITATEPVADREYYGGVTLVPASGSIVRGAPSLPWAAIIPAAVDIGRYVYNPVGGPNLMWVDDDSDSLVARRIAERANIPLLRVPVDRLAFEPDILGNALAMIVGGTGAVTPYPAAALASGTPLLALAESSGADLIVFGETGWIATSIDDAVAKIADLDLISRRVCRREAERRFSAAAVVGAYEALYRTLLPAHQPMPGTSALLGARHERRSLSSAIRVG